MTAQPIRQREEADASEPQIEAPTRAEAPGRASSLPTALPLSHPADTDSDETAWPELVRAWLAGRLSKLGQHPLDLIHGPPASIGAMHARHQQAAAHWKSPAARGLRTAWGWLHTAVYAAWITLMDATFSPAGALLAVLFVLTLIYWL